MNARRTACALMLIALGALFIPILGCSKKAGGKLFPDQPPTVRLTNAPYSEVTRYYYSITINWIGFDPDGRIDHFLFAIDPPKDPGSDTTWEVTTRNQVTRSFPSTNPDNTIPNQRGGSDFHVFVIKAVDERGKASPPVSRAFFSYTLAPTVRITSPTPSDQSRAYVTPAVLISWTGEDQDGVFTKRPIKYKFKVLSDQTEVTTTLARAKPDSVRRYYAPRNWVGWDSTSADTTSKQFTLLVPDQEYMFCVIAFDEAGAYSPTFDLNTNMLYFRVTFAGANNPTIGLFNEFFQYEYKSGSYQPNNPAIEIPIEVPAGIPIAFNWFATAIPGSAVRSYRWAVDIVDLNDESERTDDNDLAHWSPKNLEVTGCVIGPYPGGQTHRLYLEAEDINTLKSLGIVRFNTVQATLEKSLGIIDDTRYVTDSRSIGIPCMDAPLGLWPTAAELDTFLYARGGKPWKCYPAGTLSSPGIFSHYDFDTIGTQLGLQDMSVRLSTLGHYQHLIWITDANAAGNFKVGTDRSDPMTAMYYMNQSGHSNTIAAYIRQGGQVWLVGGGAPTASMRPWNRTNNDTQLPTATLTFSNPNLELIPGRFVYDQFHWRSEFKQLKATMQINRNLGRFNSSPGIYSTLPLKIEIKTAATDPLPPLRTATNFYGSSQISVEFLSKSNNIIEDYDPGPAEDFRFTLDTLYAAIGATLPPGQIAACMTYYHGLDNTTTILTGFNIWNYKRTECQGLVDFVLQKLWNLPSNEPLARAWHPPAGEGPGAAVRPAAAGGALPARRAPVSPAAPSPSHGE